jgi:hypothetical protein
VCAGLALVFFHKLLLGGMILARGDVYAYFYPYWSIRNAALLAGQVPLWTPDVFMGAPLLANSQVGLFYPPNWPLTFLDPPTGIALSLALHSAWGMLGVYALGRRTLGLARLPALLAAVLFGMGGYLAGKAEHINQFQALAWMPWAFLLLDRLGWTRRPRDIALLGAALALQFLAGHPQTVFITALGLGVYGLVRPQNHSTPETQRTPRNAREAIRARVVTVGLLAAAGVVVLALAAPQWIPTLELAGQSYRGAGADPQRALAFSFSPFLIGRGLLPSYDSLIFSEYVAYPGLIGLGLAGIGMLARGRRRRAWITLLVVGVGLALGAYNPLYWLLANLPGFSFFRVPARWLALAALALALLGGMGLQALLDGRARRWMWLAALLAMGGLAGLSPLSSRAAEDITGPALPTAATLIGWGVAAAALVIGCELSGRKYNAIEPPRRQERQDQTEGLNKNSNRGDAEDTEKYGGQGRQAVRAGLVAAAGIELLLAAGVLGLNQVVPADVFGASRFTLRQLQVYAAEQIPPGRTLSITPLEFDPGDAAALEARYAALGLSDLSTRIALVATKMREAVIPNLGLVWGLPSVDGFDGGLLPTEAYSRFTALMLPQGMERTADGRLWQMLAQPECRGACLPDPRWLNLTGTRYLILDKTADVVLDGVFYDTAFTVTPAEAAPVTFTVAPSVPADSLHLLCAGDCQPQATFVYADGRAQTLRRERSAPAGDFTQVIYRASSPTAPVEIVLGGSDGVAIRAATLVDSRAGVFQQVTLPPWRKVLSSDIKLYENMAVLPRAFVVADVQAVPDLDAALAVLADPGFDPARTVVVESAESIPTAAPDPAAAAVITAYAAERVEITARTDAPAALVLADADYPGWTALVNGQPAPVLRADGMFRAVAIPAGESRIVFAYQPGWWPGVLIVGAAAWLTWAGVMLMRKPEAVATG